MLSFSKPYQLLTHLFTPFLVTLEAYIDKYTSLVPFLAAGARGTPESDPPPEDQTSKAISLQVNGRCHPRASSYSYKVVM